MDGAEASREGLQALIRDPVFERCLEDLRKRGGSATLAAKKADDVIRSLLHHGDTPGREKFRFTRNGEHRIRNCKKIDLGAGYRLVSIQNGRTLALLFIGDHDECSRWIERNKGLEYEPPPGARIVHYADRPAVGASPAPPGEDPPDQRMIEAYEASIRERLDDATLRKIFPGLCGRRRMV